MAQLSRPKRNTGPWSATRIFMPNSPIINKDLHSFLIECFTHWDTDYNEDEKRAIIQAFPLAYRRLDMDASGKILCPVTLNFVANNQFLRRATSKFQNDIDEGSYNKTWQNRARNAMQERRAGKFDSFQVEYADELYGGDAGTPGPDSDKDELALSSDG